MPKLKDPSDRLQTRSGTFHPLVSAEIDLLAFKERISMAQLIRELTTAGLKLRLGDEPITENDRRAYRKWKRRMEMRRTETGITEPPGAISDDLAA